MKAIKYVCIAVLAAGFAACNPDVKTESLYLSEDGVKEMTADGRIYHLHELVDSFMLTEYGNYMSDTTHYRDRATDGTLYYFSIDTLPSDGPGIYIRGRVSTDDYGGNFYKALVIQELIPIEGEPGKFEQQNLRMSIDVGSASGMYPRGQELLIRCNGLALGKYANQIQLCVPSYNNNTNASSASQKVGWQPGRIPAPICKKHFMLIGKPDPQKLQYDKLTIPEIIANYDDPVAARKVDGKLIIVDSVFFDGCFDDSGTKTACSEYDPEVSLETGNPEKDPNANTFAPTTLNVGRPQSRRIVDKYNNWTLVSNSEYAKHAYFYLPFERINDTTTVKVKVEEDGVEVEKDSLVVNTKLVYGTYKGNVRGILSYYLDQPPTTKYPLYQGKWAITICDLSDLRDFIADGSQANKGGAAKGTDWIPEEWVK